MHHSFKQHILCSAAALLATQLMAPAQAAEKSNREQAVAYVQKAAIYLNKVGKDEAYKEFNRADSPYNVKSDINPNGDLYMLIWQTDGIQPVHGKQPRIVGKNVLTMRDADGVPLIAEIIKVCQSPQGKGWVSYKWPHPQSGQIEAKQTYVEKAGSVCIGTGIYL